MNIARVIKECYQAKARAEQKGHTPRCWVATKAFCEKIGKPEMLKLPILNTLVEGHIFWSGQRAEVVLLFDLSEEAMKKIREGKNADTQS